MGKRRQQRMSVEIRRILATIIQEHIKDPRIDLASLSITRVDVAQDISHARIYVSILGNDEKQQDSMQALQKARGFLRSELAHALQIRHAPEIEFRLDKSIEQGMKISTLLDNLHEKEEPKEHQHE
jgi:ribosome-binding factor A